MPKALLNVRHRAGYLDAVHSEFLKVGQYREVAQAAMVEPSGDELGRGKITHVDAEQLDERKQTELV